MSTWKKFSEIDNSYQEKKILMAKELVSPDCLWVVTEKIDGENASINITNDGIVRIGKRNSLLGENENFGKVRDFANHYKTALEYVRRHRIFLKYPSFISFTIYGESFGGVYGHKDVEKVKGAKKIQGRVHYCPHNDFMPFDISVMYSDLEGNEIHEYLDYDFFQEILSIHCIPRIKTLFIGTLDECLNYNEVFETTIPSYYGLPKIKDNFAEGIVIKPFKEHRFGNGERVIFKKKSESFAEKMKSKKVITEKEKVELPSQIVEAIEIVSQYITPNRLSNVMSHHGELTEKDFGKILKDMNEDVLKDVIKENEEVFSSLSKDDIKIIRKSINSDCAKMMKTEFFKHL